MTTTVPFDPLMSQRADLFELLCQRKGWDHEFLTSIESQEHDDLRDLDRMIAALEDARVNRRKVTIFPDFDMDGIASGVLGYAGLSELGFDVEMHLPDYERGHDLTAEDVAEMHTRWPDTQVLLTCDGGVNSHDGIAAAKALGWTTLVTDHHQELEPGSSADVTVNPCRIDETYANRGICGAHVLYQVLEEYTRVHQPAKIWQIRLLRLFAGLGTVSDVMPVLYENRQLVRDSLSIARLLLVPAPKTVPNPWGGLSGDPDQIDVENATLMQLLRLDPHHPVFVSAFQGFAVLLKAFTQQGKIRDVDSLDEGFYGFYLAPVMNSPRRTGMPMDDCFTIFTAPAVKEQLEAAHRVIENNELRKQLTVDHLEALLDSDQPLAPWVYFSDAPAGMFGLLANQMLQRSGHVTVVVPRPTDATQPLGGSGRAPEWFDIITALEGHGNPEIFAVGHQQACGVKLTRAGLLTELAQTLAERSAAAELMIGQSADQSVGDLVFGEGPDCDAPLTLFDEMAELVRRLESLRPFGHGFEEPIFQVRIPLAGLRVDRIGSDADCDHDAEDGHGEYNARGYWQCFHCKKHLRLVTRHGLPCLWWNSAPEHHERLLELVAQAGQDSTRVLAFTAKLALNTFRGETRVQALIDQEITDLEPATAEALD